MAKDPAVLFYPADFLVGCIGLTDAQVGQYIKLLCIQHQKGPLSEAIVTDICKGMDMDIISKFEIDQNGKYFNKRMAEEQERRRNYSLSRSKNRTSKPVKPSKDMNDISSTYVKHMETENETGNETVKAKGNCLMKNSGVTVAQVTQAFQKSNDLKNADAKHYFDMALDWSDAKGMMRKDWVATVRNFARNDVRDGKLKLSNFKQAGGSNLSAEKTTFTPTPVSPTAMTREEYLKQKKAKENEKKENSGD
jgi:hypothetical protein